MHFEILLEEPSAEAALTILIPKIAPDATFRLHPHRGKPDLLARLESKLRSYASYLPAESAVIVLVDRDTDDCRELKAEIDKVARRTKLKTPFLCRIAIDELEAWFLGDVPALVRTFPGINPNQASRSRFRDPDAIRDASKALERVLQDAGHYRSGLQKIGAARTIAAEMDVERNESASFRAFRDGLRRLVSR